MPADGADSVTTTGGDAALILGGGADTATLGEGLVYALARRWYAHGHAERRLFRPAGRSDQRRQLCRLPTTTP